MKGKETRRMNTIKKTEGKNRKGIIREKDEEKRRKKDCCRERGREKQ